MGLKAREVLARAWAAPPTLGSGRLVCVDGPAGSGKTTLADQIAAIVPESVIVHTDALLHGWGGLAELAGSLEALLRPLAAGASGQWTRWDWECSGWAETNTLSPTPLLILEGVGSWSPSYADLVTTLVWVHAPTDVRLARWLDRDGEAMRPYWDQWLRDEDALHARDRTAVHADLVIATGD